MFILPGRDRMERHERKRKKRKRAREKIIYAQNEIFMVPERYSFNDEGGKEKDRKGKRK